MATRPDRRRVARLTVPAPLRDADLAHHPVHVLDLSRHGARVQHQTLLHHDVVYYLDLSPALEALRLTGRLVWMSLRRTEQTLEGVQRAYYESGIEFTGGTPEQQAALARALEKLQAVQPSTDRTPSP